MDETSDNDTTYEGSAANWNIFGMIPPDSADYESCVRDWLIPSDLKALPDVLMIIIAEYGSSLECHFENTLFSPGYRMHVVDFDTIGLPIPLSDFHNGIHKHMCKIRLRASVQTRFGIFDQLSDMSWAFRSDDLVGNAYFGWVSGLHTLGFPDDAFIVIDDDPRYSQYKIASAARGEIATLNIHDTEKFKGRLMLRESIF